MLVSAVMPTRGRTTLARLAVDCFLAQSYTDKELVILDDFDCPSFPDGVTHPLIRYSRTGNIRYSIPEKRNQVNALAQGEIIFHLDSDDWSAPERMAAQVHRLEVTGKAMTGYYSMFFHEEQSGLAWNYKGIKTFACGSSLCYRKSFWKSFKFHHSHRTGSDVVLVANAHAAKQLDNLEGGNMMVARIHDDNTCKKDSSKRGKNYLPVPLETLPAEFLALTMTPQ